MFRDAFGACVVVSATEEDLLVCLKKRGFMQTYSLYICWGWGLKENKQTKNKSAFVVNHLLLGVRVKKDLVRPKMPTEKFFVRQVYKVCDVLMTATRRAAATNCVLPVSHPVMGCAMGGINPHHGCMQPQTVPFSTALGVSSCQGEHWARCVLSQA